MMSGGVGNTEATWDLTVTSGPPFNVCFAATRTVPSSVAGLLNVTVPLMLCELEGCNVKDALLVLMVVMLLVLGTGTEAMTAVAWPSAVITTS